MTVRIHKSEADALGDFAAMVAKHAVEMKNWRAHEVRVKDDATKENVAPIDRHWPLKRPVAHPLVERAVNDKDEMDFELEDDTPSPEQVLRTKKNKLVDVVTMAENAAVEAIFPRGRIRLSAIRENKIRERDNAAMAELVGAPSLVKTLKNTVGLGPKIEDIVAEVARRRPAADSLHLDEQQNRRDAIEAIRSKSAIAHDAIEDLTLDTIDGFTIPDFTTKD